MKTKTLYGTSKYCHQTKTLEVAEDLDLTEDELNEKAARECNCPEATENRNRQMSMSAAQEYVREIFEPNGEFPDDSYRECLKLAYAAIETVGSKAISSASFKVGKKTFKFTRNADGELKVSDTMTLKNEEVF